MGGKVKSKLKSKLKSKKFTSTDDYLESLTKENKKILQAIRAEVQKKIPSAVETISYNLPAFKEKKVFFFFAAFKNHIGIYPPVRDLKLKKKLKAYMNERGNLAFPTSEAVPIKLIAQVALALWKENVQNVN